MKIAFVDLKRQNKIYKTKLLNVIEKIIRDSHFLMGEPLENFERQFAAFCGKKYCIGLNSGTDALFLALLAYGIKPGDEVITVPNSYFATAMVISNIGAVPVFVDINPLNYTMDVTQLESKITPKTRAIIPVHLCGQPADMDPIITIAKKYHLHIIEDCCQAHNARYKSHIVPYTETGAFSFYPGKNLGAFGDAGALVTDNKHIKEQVELLRNDGSIHKYVHIMLGYKSRMDNLQAAILSFKLKHLPAFTKKRRLHAKRYDMLLADIAQVKTPQEMDYAYHPYHLYMIECKNRDALQAYLAKQGIETVIHYPTPIHLQTPYTVLGFKKGDFPVTEQKAESIISLPMFPELRNSEINYVCRAIKTFYSEKNK